MRPDIGPATRRVRATRLAVGLLLASLLVAIGLLRSAWRAAHRVDTSTAVDVMPREAEPEPIGAAGRMDASTTAGPRVALADGGVLRVDVLDAGTGSPVAGARVEIAPEPLGPALHVARTRPDGSASLPFVPEWIGSFVRAGDAGFAWAGLRIAGPDVLRIALQPATRVHGRVLRPDGAPAGEGVRVLCWPSERDADPGRALVECIRGWPDAPFHDETAEDGSFSFSSLPVGTPLSLFAAGRGLVSDRVLAPSGEDEFLEVATVPLLGLQLEFVADDRDDPIPIPSWSPRIDGRSAIAFELPRTGLTELPDRVAAIAGVRWEPTPEGASLRKLFRARVGDEGLAIGARIQMPGFAPRRFAVELSTTLEPVPTTSLDLGPGGSGVAELVLDFELPYGCPAPTGLAVDVQVNLQDVLAGSTLSGYAPLERGGKVLLSGIPSGRYRLLVSPAHDAGREFFHADLRIEEGLPSRVGHVGTELGAILLEVPPDPPGVETLAPLFVGLARLREDHQWEDVGTAIFLDPHPGGTCAIPLLAEGEYRLTFRAESELLPEPPVPDQLRSSSTDLHLEGVLVTSRTCTVLRLLPRTGV